jgi:hypothetical protein
MRLTVGPLPPAVYWRRRAAIVGILLVLVVALFYSCSNTSKASLRSGAHGPLPSGSPTPTTTSLPSPTTPVFTSGGGIAVQTGDGGDSKPSSAPSPEPPPPASGPCTDGEMTIVASPAQASVQRGTFVRFYFRIKNVSNRSCTRDVGADAQELYVQDAAKAKVWSSDTCNPRHGTDVRTFNPGDQFDFFWDWDGKASNAGCGKQQAPPAGKYGLVGRLATKFSDPASLELK